MSLKMDNLLLISDFVLSFVKKVFSDKFLAPVYLLNKIFVLIFSFIDEAQNSIGRLLPV